MIFTCVTFVFFTILVAVISYVKTKGDDQTTADGYFLAGRGLPGIVIAGSLLLTNLSAEQLVGNNGQAVRVGMSTMGWEVTSAIALVILAFVLMPKYLKTGLTTVPQFFEQRYDEGTRRLVSIIVLLSYVVIMLPNILYAGAQVFVNIFGIDEIFGISRFAAIAIVCVATAIVGSIYAIFGGLKAVAVSDTVNGVGLLIGGLLIPILSICILGNGSFLAGIQDFITNVPAEKFNAVNPANALPPMIPWPVLFLGMLFNNLFYWCTNQSIIQRTLAAKNLAQAQRGAVFTAFLKLLDPFFITICGLLAYRFFGDGLANSDLAYPSLITTVVPNWLLGIIAAVLFGAILSSFNSALNSCVTLYTLDFHRPLFNQTASDSHLVSVGKRVGTGLAIVSICVAPFVSNAPSGLYDFLQECFGFYSMPILAIVLVGFYTKRVPACAPKITLVVHVILYSISKFLPLNVHYLYVLSVLFPVDLALMLLIGKFKPRATDFILEDSKAVDLTPWKYVKPAALTCFILMLCVYALFSPIGLAR